MLTQGAPERSVPKSATYDAYGHYSAQLAPVDEFDTLPETESTIRNVGWTLGNDCPYRCTHCYSMSARAKGKDLSIAAVDRIVGQLSLLGTETVNLGGNEPLYTNGLRASESLLPYIIHKLREADIEVGLTTAGITALYLHRHHPDAFEELNDIDVSLDSPIEAEHDRSRGARLFGLALKAMRVCQEGSKPHAVIMAGMRWNFTLDRIEKLVELARRHGAMVRVNPLKPVESQHMDLSLPAEMYYAGFARLM